MAAREAAKVERHVLDAVVAPAPPDAAFSRHDLLLDPRHTGGNNLSEFLFLMHLGALQWQEIARFAGKRLRELRSDDGKPVYASFFYVHERFSPARPLSAFDIDELITILSGLRLCGSTMLDGWHLLYGEETPERERAMLDVGELERPGAPASVRMSNVFVKKRTGPDHLQVTFPANVDLARFPGVEWAPETYDLVQRVKAEGRFRPAPGRALAPLGPAGFRFRYEINPDRDINGVGLVYFANYIAFLDMAERALLRQAAWPEERIDRRSLVEREIAYYGNAKSTDVVTIEIDAHHAAGLPGTPAGFGLVRFDYRARRESDGRLICISSAVKRVLAAG